MRKFYLEAAQKHLRNKHAQTDRAIYEWESTPAFDAAYLTFEPASQLEARIEQLRLGAHTTAMLAGSSAKGFADTLYGLFQSVAKFNATIKAFVEAKLAPFYARHGNRHDNPKP